MRTERNCDKIKRLEKAVEAEREKRRNADIEIMRMHKVLDLERNNAALQLAEVSTLTDGFVIALTIRHGANVGEGVWELSMPVYSPTELCVRYTVHASREGEKYIVRVEEKRDGKSSV